VPPKLKKPAEKDVSPETAIAELVGVEPEDIAELPCERSTAARRRLRRPLVGTMETRLRAEGPKTRRRYGGRCSSPAVACSPPPEVETSEAARIVNARLRDRSA
jgi:hypothetical protein